MAVAGGKVTPLGKDFVVNSTTANVQYSPTITTLADGRFVAAWTDASQSGIEKTKKSSPLEETI